MNKLVVRPRVSSDWRRWSRTLRETAMRSHISMMASSNSEFSARPLEPRRRSQNPSLTSTKRWASITSPCQSKASPILSPHALSLPMTSYSSSSFTTTSSCIITSYMTTRKVKSRERFTPRRWTAIRRTSRTRVSTMTRNTWSTRSTDRAKPSPSMQTMLAMWNTKRWLMSTWAKCTWSTIKRSLQGAPVKFYFSKYLKTRMILP